MLILNKLDRSALQSADAVMAQVSLEAKSDAIDAKLLRLSMQQQRMIAKLDSLLERVPPKDR